MKIKELPSFERPREKALKYGIEYLSNEELLAIVLRTGYRQMNVKQLASNILAELGGLDKLFQADYHTLMKIKGIKKVKALTLASFITLSNRLSLYKNDIEFSIDNFIKKYQLELLNSYQEKVYLVILNSRGKFLSEKMLNIGSSHNVNISIRDIIREIYINNGHLFFLFHTHPISIKKPSLQDMIFTDYLIEKLKRTDIKLIDHIIIGVDGHYSIKNKHSL